MLMYNFFFLFSCSINYREFFSFLFGFIELGVFIGKGIGRIWFIELLIILLLFFVYLLVVIKKLEIS